MNGLRTDLVSGEMKTYQSLNYFFFSAHCCAFLILSGGAYFKRAHLRIEDALICFDIQLRYWIECNYDELSAE